MSPTSATTAGTGMAVTQQCAPAAVRTVVCYARTVNPGTAGQRHLQRQRAKLQAACAARGWTVLEWIEDPYQFGTTLNRPGLHRALALLATDATHLAVDALVTSQLVALADQQGWRLLTVTPTRTFIAAPAATVVDPSRSRGPGRGGARR